MERYALCGLRTDAGQPAELVDEILNGPFVHVSPGSDRATRSHYPG
jgi:hypothetical protein